LILSFLIEIRILFQLLIHQQLLCFNLLQIAKLKMKNIF
jgi:hypothetical protein